ncbi:MAG: hypothetical protein HOP05_03890 [Ferruginibacter sp.]|nr:hypothetical protein [Ferruginibacter sp.]
MLHLKSSNLCIRKSLIIRPVIMKLPALVQTEKSRNGGTKTTGSNKNIV